MLDDDAHDWFTVRRWALHFRHEGDRLRRREERLRAMQAIGGPHPAQQRKLQLVHVAISESRAKIAQNGDMIAKLDACQRQFFCKGLKISTTRILMSRMPLLDKRIKSRRRRRRRSNGLGYNELAMPFWAGPDRPMQPPKYAPLKKVSRPRAGRNHMS
eukprot:6520908-Pyramimonas_sp.AAC.1